MMARDRACQTLSFNTAMECEVDNFMVLRTHRIHVWYIYLHLADFDDVGKYASPMDGIRGVAIFWPTMHLNCIFENMCLKSSKINV